MNEMIYTYDGSFEGFLCCIFDSYANKEVLTAITDDEDSAPILFPVRAIQTDSGHAGRVLRKLHKLSPYGEELVRRGFLTCMEDREIRLYRLVVKLLREGPGFLRNFSDETLHPVAAAVRHLNGEAHLLKGFLRFSELGGILGSEIEPKNRVLPILRGHFCARYQNEKFFIYDSRAIKSIGKLVKIPDKKFLANVSDYDQEYGYFVCRMLELQEYLYEKLGTYEMPRSIDSFLLWTLRKKK